MKIIVFKTLFLLLLFGLGPIQIANAIDPRLPLLDDSSEDDELIEVTPSGPAFINLDEFRTTSRELIREIGSQVVSDLNGNTAGLATAPSNADIDSTISHLRSAINRVESHHARLSPARPFPYSEVADSLAEGGDLLDFAEKLEELIPQINGLKARDGESARDQLLRVQTGLETTLNGIRSWYGDENSEFGREIESLFFSTFETITNNMQSRIPLPPPPSSPREPESVGGPSDERGPPSDGGGEDPSRRGEAPLGDSDDPREAELNPETVVSAILDPLPESDEGGGRDDSLPAASVLEDLEDPVEQDIGLIVSQLTRGLSALLNKPQDGSYPSGENLRVALRSFGTAIDDLTTKLSGLPPTKRQELQVFINNLERLQSNLVRVMASIGPEADVQLLLERFRSQVRGDLAEMNSWFGSDASSFVQRLVGQLENTYRGIRNSYDNVTQAELTSTAQIVKDLASGVLNLPSDSGDDGGAIPPLGLSFGVSFSSQQACEFANVLLHEVEVDVLANAWKDILGNIRNMDVKLELLEGSVTEYMSTTTVTYMNANYLRAFAPGEGDLNYQESPLSENSVLGSEMSFNIIDGSKAVYRRRMTAVDVDKTVNYTFMESQFGSNSRYANSDLVPLTDTKQISNSNIDELFLAGRQDINEGTAVKLVVKHRKDGALQNLSGANLDIARDGGGDISFTEVDQADGKGVEVTIEKDNESPMRVRFSRSGVTNILWETIDKNTAEIPIQVQEDSSNSSREFYGLRISVTQRQSQFQSGSLSCLISAEAAVGGATPGSCNEQNKENGAAGNITLKVPRGENPKTVIFSHPGFTSSQPFPIPGFGGSISAAEGSNEDGTPTFKINITEVKEGDTTSSTEADIYDKINGNLVSICNRGEETFTCPSVSIKDGSNELTVNKQTREFTIKFSLNGKENIVGVTNEITIPADSTPIALDIDMDDNSHKDYAILKFTPKRNGTPVDPVEMSGLSVQCKEDGAEDSTYESCPGIEKLDDGKVKVTRHDTKKLIVRGSYQFARETKNSDGEALDAKSVLDLELRRWNNINLEDDFGIDKQQYAHQAIADLYGTNPEDQEADARRRILAQNTNDLSFSNTMATCGFQVVDKAGNVKNPNDLGREWELEIDGCEGSSPEYHNEGVLCLMRKQVQLYEVESSPKVKATLKKDGQRPQRIECAVGFVGQASNNRLTTIMGFIEDPVPLRPPLAPAMQYGIGDSIQGRFFFGF